MAYLKLFFIIVASLPFMFVSASHSSLDYDNVKTLSRAKTDEKVNLSLYYETLCPYCASFISEDLIKVFQDDLDTIVNLRLVPYGNADIVNNTIQCQHGEEECYLNTIHGCVIHLYPDVKTHFSFIRCTEKQSLESGQVKTNEERWVPCSRKLRLSEHRIKKCYNTGYGYKLQLQYANETASLNPPHEYVPWVVVNNHPLRNYFENFVKYVCQAYKGDPVPEACKKKSSKVSSAKKANEIHQGCYATGLFGNSASSTSAKIRPRNEIEP